MRETAKAISAFEQYWLLGKNRSLVKLQKHLQDLWGKEGVKSPTLTTLETWSSQHKWQDRLAKRERKYEAEAATRKRKKMEEDVDKMNDRHASIGVNAQLQALEVIKQIIDLGELNANQAITLLKMGTDLERVSRGAATQVTKTEIAGSEAMPLVIKTIWDKALIEQYHDDEALQLPDSKKAE